MSVARVNYVRRSRKPYKCGKCHNEIPVGSAYRWFTVGFRSTYANIRCMKSTCDPRPSERESSQMASVMAAAEDAEASLYALVLTGPDDVQYVTDAMSDVATAMREVADLYEEADSNFGGGGNTDMYERAETLRSNADELEDWTPQTEEPSACDEHDDPEEGCDACEAERQEWADGVIGEAVDAINDAMAV